MLVAAGADPMAKTKSGETALTIARDRDVGRKPSHDRIYQFLLEVTRLNAVTAEVGPGTQVSDLLCRVSPVGCFGKASNGRLFVGINLENFVQPSDHQYPVNLFRRIHKL